MFAVVFKPGCRSWGLAVVGLVATTVLVGCSALPTERAAAGVTLERGTSTVPTVLGAVQTAAATELPVLTVGALEVHSLDPAFVQTTSEREIASLVGVTERTAMQIIIDLEDDGYITRERHGRRNHYRIQADHPLRHPLEEHHEIQSLLGALEHEPVRQPVGDG